MLAETPPPPAQVMLQLTMQFAQFKQLNATIVGKIAALFDAWRSIWRVGQLYQT